MDDNVSRRTFYQRVIYFLTSVIAAALAAPAVLYIFLPARGETESGWADAGDINDLPKGKPHEVVFQRKRQDGWKLSVERVTAWVLRTDDEIIAFSPQCPHLGCGYHWEAGKDHFLCPCHVSTFSKLGRVLSGPSPRPLDRFATRVEGNRLWLGHVERSVPEDAA